MSGIGVAPDPRAAPAKAASVIEPEASFHIPLRQMLLASL
jgi:hypothetical protein